MRLIKLKEVKEMTTLAKPTIYRLIAAGMFPKQVSTGERSVAWVLSEVEDWISGRMAEREGK